MRRDFSWIQGQIKKIIANYEIPTEAKEDLFRIYEYGFLNFGERRANEYFNDFFENLDRIAKNPFHFPSAEYIKKDYRKCVSGEDTIYFKIEKAIVIIVYIIESQVYPYPNPKTDVLEKKLDMLFVFAIVKR